MNNSNEAYAEYVKWRDAATYLHDDCYEFIVMWSDYTWSLFKVPAKGFWIKRNGVTKTYKQVMKLNKMVSQKMTKKEAEAYINERIAEYAGH